jgi:hypothetical protein
MCIESAKELQHVLQVVVIRHKEQQDTFQLFRFKLHTNSLSHNVILPTIVWVVVNMGTNIGLMIFVGLARELGLNLIIMGALTMQYPL